MDRVIAYIDGFNLYYGLKSKKMAALLLVKCTKIGPGTD